MDYGERANVSMPARDHVNGCSNSPLVLRSSIGAGASVGASGGATLPDPTGASPLLDCNSAPAIAAPAPQAHLDMVKDQASSVNPPPLAHLAQLPSLLSLLFCSLLPFLIH